MSDQQSYFFAIDFGAKVPSTVFCEMCEKGIIKIISRASEPKIKIINGEVFIPHENSKN